MNEQTQDKVGELRAILQRMRPEFERLGKVDGDRVTRIVENAIQANPKLAECTPRSILQAVMTCVQCGLEPDSAAQWAHLVPFKGQCQLIFGYQGLMELANRHPKVLNFFPPQIVRADDEFDVQYGTHPSITHRKHWVELEDHGILGAYAVAHLASDDRPFMHMTLPELERIRAAALEKAWKPETNPWNLHTEAMYMKTVVRRLCKWLPKSRELSIAVTIDKQAEAGLRQTMERLQAVETVLNQIDLGNGKSRSERLLDRVRAANGDGQSSAPALEPVARDPDTGELAADRNEGT